MPDLVHRLPDQMEGLRTIPGDKRDVGMVGIATPWESAGRCRRSLTL
jgi:hypothetical protein